MVGLPRLRRHSLRLEGAMRRTFSPDKFNEVANRTKIRSLLGGEGDLDFSAPIQNVDNFFLETEHGGFFYHNLYGSVFEVHTIFEDRVPARKVRRAAQDSLEYMFIKTACDAVKTKVPSNNPGAAWLCDNCAFHTDFVRKNAWAPGVDMSFRSLTLDRWLGVCSTLEEGRAFHGLLERSGKHPNHPDDEAHDRAVGAAVRMIRAGNVEKGVATYNKWAVFAGYMPVRLMSVNPTVVDIGTAIVGVNDGRVEVL